jgi:hypothetical protein
VQLLEALDFIFCRPHSPTDCQAGCNMEPHKHPTNPPQALKNDIFLAPNYFASPHGTSIQPGSMGTCKEMASGLSVLQTRILWPAAPETVVPSGFSERLEGRLFSAVPWQATASVSLVSAFSEGIVAVHREADAAARQQQRKKRTFALLPVRFHASILQPCQDHVWAVHWLQNCTY